MKSSGKNSYQYKNLSVPIIIFTSFWIVAIILWQTMGNIFYLFNFGYIGTAIGLGIGLYVVLPRKKKPSGRRIAQLLVGIYLLVFLGISINAALYIYHLFRIGSRGRDEIYG